MLPVFDIKRYSINDGPGIRITLFFKGCPLSCVWCHNPEGMSPRQTKLYTINKCIACKRCIKVCSQNALHISKGKGIVTDISKCVLCGTCAKACPAGAMEMALKNYTVEDLMAEIEKERPFFETSSGSGNATPCGEASQCTGKPPLQSERHSSETSRGGVTLCGGEPLLQREKIFPLLDACGERGIHRVVDTTLYADPKLVLEVAKRCELFLVDLKHMDSDLHKKLCGIPNELVLSNIRLIASMGIDFIIRIPLIVGVNADEKNLHASAAFLSSLGITRNSDEVNPQSPAASLTSTGITKNVSCKNWNGPLVELLPYHDIAKGKHIRLGTTYNPSNIPMSTPTPEQLEKARAIFAEYGIEAK